MTRPTARRRRRIAGQAPRTAGLAGVVLGALLATGAGAEPQATLVLDLSRPAVKGQPYDLPVGFTFTDTTVTALAFSIDIDTRRLDFDPADDDMDGVPDSVTLPAGMPSITYIGYDPDDAGGEIDVMLANLSGAPLPQGVLLLIELEARREGSASRWIDFADDPPPSFGNAQGSNVDGTTLVLGLDIFADGFESGNTSAWSIVRPGGED